MGPQNNSYLSAPGKVKRREKGGYEKGGKNEREGVRRQKGKGTCQYAVLHYLVAVSSLFFCRPRSDTVTSV